MLVWHSETMRKVYYGRHTEATEAKLYGHYQVPYIMRHTDDFYMTALQCLFI